MKIPISPSGLPEKNKELPERKKPSDIMINKYLIILISSFFCCLHAGATGSIDSLLHELDAVIDSSKYYEQAKRDRIDVLRETVRRTPTLSPREEYRYNVQLYDAYKTYICDSAMFYINRSIAVARRCKDASMLDAALIMKAELLGRAGLYAEGQRLMSSINKDRLDRRLLIEYYLTYSNFYLYCAEYTKNTEYNAEYLSKLYDYRDSVLQIARPGSYEYMIMRAPQLLEKGRGREGLHLLKGYIRQLGPDTRDYAVVTSIMAFISMALNDRHNYEVYLIKSAMADIRGVVKENNSLRMLAELLYADGQLKRADTYMKISMEDANFFNARLRNLQAARMLPVIDRAFQVEKERNISTLKIFLLIITLLAFFLVCTVLHVIRQMRRLAKARCELLKLNSELQQLNIRLEEVNRRQCETNDRLTEANIIKEEYVGHFLNLCSAYIGKLDVYRRMLNRLAASNKLAELFKTLKSTGFIDAELKDFYSNFDRSFLSIFPDFVAHFNELLPPGEQIIPKQGERLTTELRIFALIRLGITDSAKIASFLHYSITTIYTYRSKIKNRSLCHDSFEKEIMKIGTFNAS